MRLVYQNKSPQQSLYVNRKLVMDLGLSKSLRQSMYCRKRGMDFSTSVIHTLSQKLHSNIILFHIFHTLSLIQLLNPIHTHYTLSYST